jgi:hypothetical protein
MCEKQKRKEDKENTKEPKLTYHNLSGKEFILLLYCDNGTLRQVSPRLRQNDHLAKLALFRPIFPYMKRWRAMHTDEKGSLLSLHWVLNA